MTNVFFYYYSIETLYNLIHPRKELEEQQIKIIYLI